jgi:hypothetical protein
MRGDDKYIVGDFCAGSTRAVGDYTTKNRVRLAGAGGSAIGMAAGAVLLGPIGLVAGSFLGASAGQSSMKAVAGDPASNERKLQDASASNSRSRGSNVSGPTSTETQIPDLLSPSDVSGNSTPQTHGPLIDNQAVDAASLNASSVEAEWIGDVATVNHRTVMVQAQVLDRPQPSCVVASNDPFSVSGGEHLVVGSARENVAMVSIPQGSAAPSFDQSSRSSFRGPNPVLHESATTIWPGMAVPVAAAAASTPFSASVRAQVNDPLSSFMMGSASPPRQVQPISSDLRSSRHQYYHEESTLGPQNPLLSSPGGFQSTHPRGVSQSNRNAMPHTSSYAASAPTAQSSSAQQRMSSSNSQGSQQVHPEGQREYRFGKSVGKIVLVSFLFVGAKNRLNVTVQGMSQGGSLPEEDKSMAGIKTAATNS